MADPSVTGTTGTTSMTKWKRRLVLAAILAVLVGLPWTCGGEHEQLGEQARRFLPGVFVRLKDGHTCFELRGPSPAPAVVFVHGFSSPSYVWGELPRAMRDAGYRTLTYDLFGRGWSDRPWVDYDLDLYDRQLWQLLRRVGLRGRVHLVGLSMGGIVVTEFALRHPELVASVSLIAPAGLAVDVPAEAAVLEVPLLGDWLMQVFGNRVLVAANSRAVHDKTRVGNLVRHFEPQLEYAGYKRAILSSLRHMPLEDFTDRYAELGRTGLPVEVFWGVQDEVTPIAGVDLAARFMPAAAVHRIEEAGHLVHYENVSAVYAPMQRFLEPIEASLQEGGGPGGDGRIVRGAPPPVCKECEHQEPAKTQGGYARPGSARRDKGRLHRPQSGSRGD